MNEPELREFFARGRAGQAAVVVALRKVSEQLVACPVCGQGGFSPRGLVAHRGRKSCQRRKERGQ